MLAQPSSNDFYDMPVSLQSEIALAFGFYIVLGECDDDASRGLRRSMLGVFANGMCLLVFLTALFFRD